MPLKRRVEGRKVMRTLLLRAATTRSLYPAFSSTWKDWKFVLPIGATRAVSCGQGLDHAGLLQIGGPDLPGRIRDDLLGRQDAFLDEASDAVSRDAERRRGLRHGEPFAVLLG